MPQLQPKYLTDNDREVLDMMSDAWTVNSQANQTFWNEGTIDTRFVSGDQHIWNELYGNYPAHSKWSPSFNRVRKTRNMVSGHQRRNRKSTVVLPQEGSDEVTADQFSTLLNWAMQRSSAYHTFSEAFEGGITAGLNMLHVWMDHRNDPINGDIQIDNLGYNQIMIDRYFSKPDMSDANFFWSRKFMAREQAASLIPDRKADILGMTGGFKDNKFNWAPEKFNIENTNLVAYDEYWHKDFRSAKILVDVASGETMEWTGNDENLREFRAQFPQVQVQEIQKETVKLAIVINDRVFYHGPNPYGIDRYPFVPVLGYFEKDSPFFEWKIQGIVRGLRDAQFLYNRRKVIELDILESQINSGFKIMEDSLVDDNHAYLSGQGRALFLKKDAPLGMASVEPLQPPQIPPSMMQLSESLANEIMEISGVNEELLGSADDDKAGILSMLRQGAGLTTLQGLFDNLDRSQKIVGELTMEMIQANWTPGKVQRILGEQPSDQFFNKAFQKFDSVVTEGVLSETQRKASFIVLFEMQKAGIAIPPEILIDKAPIPEKKDLKEAMEKQAKQQAEAQQQAQELQMKQMEAQIELAKARAMADQGLGIERLARVDENKELAVERRAKAIEDISDARLNRAKTLTELQGLPLERLQQLVEVAKTLGLVGEEPAELKTKQEIGSAV